MRLSPYVLSETSKRAFKKVSPNFSAPLPVNTCYARRSLRITHGPKHRGAGAIHRATTSTSPLCCWRGQSSPPARAVCRVFVTKRIVPVLGCDCSQTHTCERITFHLNINLPTEIFHSYWYFLWSSSRTLFSGGTMTFKISWTCALSLALSVLLKQTSTECRVFTVQPRGFLFHLVIAYLHCLTQGLFWLIISLSKENKTGKPLKKQQKYTLSHLPLPCSHFVYQIIFIYQNNTGCTHTAIK